MNQILRLFMLHRLMNIQDKKNKPDYDRHTSQKEKEQDRLQQNLILYFLSQDGNKPTT